MISFAVWSPDEATFWNSWITAGICSAPHEFMPEYSNFIQITDQTSQGWRPMDAEGNAVSGWHANIRVGGTLEQQFTYGLAQTDQNGLLPLFDRTWAAEVFQLTPTSVDPVTGFKSGYANTNGVKYADMSEWATPANVWA